MSRLYWSNLPDAKSPRGGTSTLWSSLTTEDLPMPEYPETSTSSAAPSLTMRWKHASNASISRALPSGLFRRHVGQRAGDHLWRGGGLALARQTRSDAEPRQPHAAACRFHHDICRLDILMDEATLMHMAERARERDRDAQEMRYVQWPAKQSIERRTAGILKHQLGPAALTNQLEWTRRPVGVKFGLERIFVFKSCD